MEQIARTEFIIDGNYARMGFSHLAERGVGERFYTMDFSALADYLSELISHYTGLRCVYSAKKVFMGSNSILDEKNVCFYRSLDEAGFTRSSFTLRSPDLVANRPTLKEDAVDTTIVFETAKSFYTKTREDRFNTLVLYAGDGDLVPLVKGLQSEGVRVFVIYFDFKAGSSVTRASQALLEAADKVISISSLLEERVSRQIKSIFFSIDPPTAVVEETLSQSKSFPIKSLSKDFLVTCIESCIQNPEGWVLGAHLGKEVEGRLGEKLPPGLRLKPELERYEDTFETKDSPAFSVRLRKTTGAKRVVVIKAIGGTSL